MIWGTGYSTPELTSAKPIIAFGIRELSSLSPEFENSDYRKMRRERYATFDSGQEKDFEEGRLTLEDLRRLAIKSGEPKQLSGRQELYERLLTLHM